MDLAAKPARLHDTELQPMSGLAEPNEHVVASISWHLAFRYSPATTSGPPAPHTSVASVVSSCQTCAKDRALQQAEGARHVARHLGMFPMAGAAKSSLEMRATNVSPT
jgi:hypothetical protein